ncbi:MAG: hypothetical protein PSX71_14055 [bacterium]|nr:hypothetical protein [bacterium]
MTKRDKLLEQAAALFEAFTGLEADSVEKFEMPEVKAGVLIGEIEQISYNTVRKHGSSERAKKHRYRHTFKPSARPLFAVSHDGKVLLILGNGFEFTERGITDK